MLKERTFDANGVAINYAEGPPSGPPLVLLHGGGDRWQHFLPILPSLVMRWQVYALDLRGHGKSGRVPGQYRPEHRVPSSARYVDINRRPTSTEIAAAYRAARDAGLYRFDERAPYRVL